MRSILVQGDSVRMTWGLEEPASEERRPLRRGMEASGPPPPIPAPPTEDELDYVRRMLDSLGDQLSCDPILLRRHATSLQSLDIVGQILGHVGAVIRSSDPGSAVGGIGMGDLKARLTRRNSL